MAEPLVYPVTSGQEIQIADLDNIGAIGGLADDRLLAELLRLTPYNGGLVAKCVIPYTASQTLGFGLQGDESAILIGAGPTGSVNVLPHRAVIGTRNAVSGAPSPNPAVNYSTNALACWRDIRSAIFMGSASSFSSLIALAPNSSGNPRWDLVYTTVAVDANGPSVTRRVKDPSTGVITATAVPAYLNSIASVAVVTGTPGATPSLPAMPADAGGNYNVPIGYVRVPNGFTSSSAVATTDIQSFASLNQNTGSSFQHLNARMDVQPATGNNDIDATYASSFAWNASAGGRPGPFMPPDWGGGRQVMVELDLIAGGSYSHASTTVVDTSINWLNRMVLVFFQVSLNKFANDTTGSTSRVPFAFQSSADNFFQLGNTFAQDAVLVAATSTVLKVTDSTCPLLASGSSLGLYVDGGGVMRAFVSATTPGVRVFAWLMASGKFPSY